MNGKALLMRMKASKVQKVLHIAALCVLSERLETCDDDDDDDDSDNDYDDDDVDDDGDDNDDDDVTYHTAEDRAAV